MRSWVRTPVSDGNRKGDEGGLARAGRAGAVGVVEDHKRVGNEGVQVKNYIVKNQFSFSRF